jgi:hypothetical protein
METSAKAAVRRGLVEAGMAGRYDEKRAPSIQLTPRLRAVFLGPQPATKSRIFGASKRRDR